MAHQEQVDKEVEQLKAQLHHNANFENHLLQESLETKCSYCSVHILGTYCIGVVQQCLRIQPHPRCPIQN